MIKGIRDKRLDVEDWQKKSSILVTVIPRKERKQWNRMCYLKVMFLEMYQENFWLSAGREKEE